ncbi:MAG: ComEC family competence protein [Alistipes sp.]|nr:ComEC family competence protein [Alistipes sp.]
MKRKMIGAAAAYLSGLFFASFFTGTAAAVLLICAAVIIFICGSRRGFKAADYICIVICFMAAVTVNRLYTVFRYDKIMAYDGTVGNFQGEVIDYDIYDGDRASYILEGTIDGGQKAKICLYATELDVKYGDMISLKSCYFERITGDYLFDSETYYRSRNIFLRVYSCDELEIVHTGTRLLRNAANRFRNEMISRFRQLMGSDAGGFMSGMIFGEKQYLDSGIRDILYRSGIGHILAVSGLHVSIMASAAMAIMRRARVNRYIAFGAVNLFFLLIIILANYPVSAIRAVMMLDIMYAAPLFRRQNDSFNSLAAAALIICLANPYAVYSSGFILSVSGTFGIAVFAPYMAEGIKANGISGAMKRSLVTALCTSLSVMPAMLHYYDEVSLISPLSNIFIVPICSIAMLIGLLFILTGGFITPLLVPARLMISAVLSVTKAVSSVNFFRMPELNGMTATVLTTASVIILFIYFFSPKRRSVVIALAISLAVFTMSFTAMRNTSAEMFTIAFLGKNSIGAVVVSYRDTAAVVDLNGHYKNPQYAAKYITEKGLDDVSLLILTENVQSLYASYLSEMELFTIAAVCTDGNKVGDSKAFYGNYQADVGEFSVEVEENRLKIVFGDRNFTVGDGEIYQGKGLLTPLADDEELSCNFELTLSSEGITKIRSL